MRPPTSTAKRYGVRELSKRGPCFSLLRHALSKPLILGLLIGSFVHTAAVFAQSPPDYRLRPGDRLSYTVQEAPELGLASTQVSTEGILTLAGAMGRLQVSGLTAGEVQTEIQRRLERDLRSATVRVTIDSTNNSSVRLLGAVATSGERKISSKTTILELLTMTNELSGANAGIAQIRRRSEALGVMEQIEIPLRALLEQYDQRYNIPLQDGDMITIPPDIPITVVFVGEVNREVTFLAAEPKTLIRAVAKVGGLTERASNRIEITRTLPDGSKQKLVARYKRILNGREPDIVLQANDLVLIKKSVI